MTDLVSQLVGALEASRAYIARYGYTGEQLAIIDAALTAAKAGGWVAVPVEPTEEMIREVEHAARLGAVWTAASVYKAMLEARPTTPPEGASMTTPQPAALPECIAHVEDWPDDRTPIGLVWDVDPASVPVGTKLYALAALQPQPAAAVSDAEIERIFKKCGGKWNGDHWVIEDADLHPAIREFLALRPQAVPSLDTLKQHLACDIECSVYENTVLPAIERWECHHNITAQGAQGGEG